MDFLSATDPIRDRPWLSYPIAIVVVLITFLIRLAISDFAPGYPYLSFLPAIIISSFLGGFGPGVVAVCFSAYVVQRFFVASDHSVVPANPAQWLAVIVYFLNATITIGLMSAIIAAHRQQKRLQAQLRDFNSVLEDKVAARTGELKAEMEAHAETQAKIRQLQKMETIGHLTGGLAHDFNNMLAIIIGSLDLAQRRLTGSEDPRLSSSLRNAREGALRAAALTARLLAFARQQPLAPEVVDVNRLVTGMSEMLRRTLGEQIRIETVLAGGLWLTYADAGQLENALLNLGINARDAMPSGGRLTIETANMELDDRYARQHAEVEAGQYVMISVTDTGTGMTQDVIDRAFEPFFTTKEAGKGTGLGLSQVYGYVKQSHGHIRIYSEIGGGTNIKVYLPRYTGPKSGVTPARNTSAIPQSDGRQTILVVEDDHQVREMTVDSLRELGYVILEAGGGVEALAQLEANPHVDLLFTDIVMPEMTGRQLADIVVQRWPDVKILYTTGYTRNAIVHNGVLDHGVSLLGKPFSFQELAFKIRDILSKPHPAG